MFDHIKNNISINVEVTMSNMITNTNYVYPRYFRRSLHNLDWVSLSITFSLFVWNIDKGNSLNNDPLFCISLNGDC